VVFLARGRRSVVIPAAIGVGSFALSILFALDVNEVNSLKRWPGWLDLIRRHPLRAGALFLAANGLLATINWFRHRGEPDPASRADVLESTETIKAHIDESVRSRLEPGLIDQLPPFPREIILSSGDEQEVIWRAVKVFADPALNPYTVAREWAIAAPDLDGLPAAGRLAVAELLYAYAQVGAALTHMRAALRMGVSPRTYWLVRAAQLAAVTSGDNAPEVQEFLDQVASIEPAYPLLIALRCVLSKQWQAACDAVAEWEPTSTWERDTRANVRASALAQLNRLDEAIVVLEHATTHTQSAGLLVLLSRMLQERSLRGAGDSRWADALAALDVGLRARNLRRAWRGPSAEAVVVAGEAALAAGDAQRAWVITRPTPQGEATGQEAEDTGVLVIAAIAAVLTGKVDQARDLAAQTDDAYQRARIEAEFASAGGDSQTSITAWRRAYNAATTDDQKLQALDRLAKEGFLDQHALDALRDEHPSDVEEIEFLHAITSTTGPDADERLRAWEARSPLASVQRASLIRQDDPRKAVEILTDAAGRHNDPRLLLMAISCYIEAGEWKLAEDLAEQTVADGGSLWPGRGIVLRRLLTITWELRSWPKVARTSRALLEIDPDDEDARWFLAMAQFHTGEMEAAWHTLNRAGTLPPAALAGRACYLLELMRRFGDAELVARTALDAIKAFPGDQDVHAAALNALVQGPDLSGLAEQVGGEITAAWASFIEQYPESRYFTAFALREGENPFADIEAMMREHAEGFQKVLAAVRDNLLPLGMLTRFSGKPYAATFIYRPLGYHRAASPGPLDIAHELTIAREARSHDVIVDASALYTLALIPGVAPILTAQTHRPAVTDAAFSDLIASDDHFNMPSNWSLDYDHVHHRLIATEHSAEVADRQRTLIRRMLETARTLRRITHPTLQHLTVPAPEQEAVWRLTLDAAKETGAILWSDDLGLRNIAHQAGVKAFGTDSMLALARGHNRINEEEAAQATRTLIREYTVDLPFDLSLLEAVAAEENWTPGPVATVLTRPATWRQTGPAETLVHHALRHAPEDQLPQWSHAAMTGLRAQSSEQYRDNNTTALITRVLCASWSGPQHAAALSTALIVVTPENSASIMRASLERTWSQLLRTHGQNEAAVVLRHLINRLDQDLRAHGADLIAASAN
jgi:hypothetical protein